MKQIIYPILFAVIALFTSCDDKLDILPKGKSTLSTVSEIEDLMNQEWRIYPNACDLGTVCNTCYLHMTQLSSTMSKPNSIDYAITAYDESVDRADLCTSDSRYASIYSYINYMNVVISKAPDATGDKSRIPGLVAEAKVIRAWLHYLLVNIHARQYDDRTAGSLGGIPYIDNTNVQEEKTKLSLKDVYDHILKDCSDEVIASLKEGVVANPCRIDKAFGYGVRARVLLQMKHYDEALKYAQLALSVNDKIEDRSYIKTSGDWTPSEKDENHYLFINAISGGWGDLYAITISGETAKLLEPGDYTNEYIPRKSYAWDDVYGEMYGGRGALFAGFEGNFNIWGLRTEQMIYTAAESLIRQGKYREGLEMMDKVREKRIDPSKYKASTDKITGALSEAAAMKLLQDAKAIEMCFTFENFFDRKRWNSEDAYKETITRDLGDDYGVRSISPDSPLWVFPFPQKATNFNKSLTQNF